eukprot:m51a1_g10961 hypothetical protein (216) ;mRNA; f:219851-221135
MQDDRQLRPVEGVRLGEELRQCVGRVKLQGPEFFVFKGQPIYEPFNEIQARFLKGSEYLMRDENGFRVQAGMSDDIKSIENGMRGNHLGNPRYVEEFGKVVVEPAEVVEPHMGSPVMFAKREFARVGTSGFFSYDIGDTDSMVALMWSVPGKDKESGFNVHCMARKELTSDVVKVLRGDLVPSKQGKIVREECGFKIEASMGSEEKAILVVRIMS